MVAVARGEGTGEVQRWVAGATACYAIEEMGRGAGLPSAGIDHRGQG